MDWEQEINVPDAIGKDPVKLLEEQLQKRGINIQIVAMCNDSVATLMAHSYNNNNACVGVVLGSGTNAAYVELTSNIPKLHTEVASPTMVVSMEWGALGNHDHSCLPISFLDEEIDSHTLNPGKQYLEKLMNDYYLGELTRLWIRHLRQENQLLSRTPLQNRLFCERYCFDSPLCTTILLDDSEDREEIRSILESFGISDSTTEDRNTIHEIVDYVITRSARLMGASLFCVLSHMQEYGLVGSVGVDGNVYSSVPGYRARVIKALAELGMDNVSIGKVTNGTSKGVALIAYSSCNPFI